MRRLDLLASCQIGNRPGQLQHPVIPSREQIHLPHRHPYQALPRSGDNIAPQRLD